MEHGELQRRLSALNILGVYYSAPEATKQYGKQWYNIAYKTFDAIADKSGLNVERVIGAASGLSPNNKWPKNVIDAEHMAQGYSAGANLLDIKVSTYNNNKHKTIDILQLDCENLEQETEATRTILNGLKTKAFYDCIRYAGQPDYLRGINSVCVDGHAKNIYYGERHSLSSTKSSITKKEYYKIADAYCCAAEVINEIEQGPPSRAITGCQVQAVTWNHWRDMHNIK